MKPVVPAQSRPQDKPAPFKHGDNCPLCKAVREHEAAMTALRPTREK